MPPQETTNLLAYKHISFQDSDNTSGQILRSCFSNVVWASLGTAIVGLIFLLTFVNHNSLKGGLQNVVNGTELRPVGPYKLLECQEGRKFFDFYDFYEGKDSLGSAGYNYYVGKDKAWSDGLVNVTEEKNGDQFVYIQSQATEKGMRDSVRLEGKRRFNHGLFILDLEHMPVGCGVWPAFWLTDEDRWPENGEIDIVEGVNRQEVAKTALHTSESCSMYAHVSPYDTTGYWDSATGIPNGWTGKPDFDTKVEADNCWVMAAHQWQNQGCVAISSQTGTLGEPLNKKGGGIFALQWDPENRYIRSWVFPSLEGIPENLQSAIDTAGKHANERITPDPNSWGLPYGYFAVGETTGCSADHFKNMRIVINLAFCGTVSGNRFLSDCPVESELFLVMSDPVATCNAFIKSEPSILDEAYWKIRGIYVYEREMGKHSSAEQKGLN
jgi:hypothetical protein